MDFDWTHFLALARELAGDLRQSACQEARLRCAISRAYYSAFNIAKTYYEKKEGRSRRQGAEVHGEVISWFAIGGTENHRSVADDLDRLREERNKADYDPGLDVSIALFERNAHKAITRATEVIGMVRRL
ncbi:MAG: HEPN domain-containing protein [Desulfomonilaceae bacterium]